MLTENDVVDHVCSHLQANGWNIVGRCATNQAGIDIEAEKDGRYLLVEAKGATSSKAHSKRFGQPFNQNQVVTHISVALYRALSLKQLRKCEVAIAFPDDSAHRTRISSISRALSEFQIAVFWVADTGSVIAE